MKRISRCVCLILVSIFLVSFVTYHCSRNWKNETSLGSRAVHLLYEFQNLDELSRNMDSLHSIVTDDVFNELTIDKEGRRMSSYLRFMAKPTGVKIIRDTEDYVLYSLDSELIDSGRIFLFLYNTNGNKINYVREAEIIDFVETND